MTTPPAPHQRHGSDGAVSQAQRVNPEGQEDMFKQHVPRIRRTIFIKLEALRFLSWRDSSCCFQHDAYHLHDAEARPH